MGFSLQLGVTTNHVTHDPVEAMTMADKVVVLRGGEVDQVCAPLALFDRPAKTCVATCIGAAAMHLTEGDAVPLPAGMAQTPGLRLGLVRGVFAGRVAYHEAAGAETGLMMICGNWLLTGDRGAARFGGPDGMVGSRPDAGAFFYPSLLMRGGCGMTGPARVVGSLDSLYSLTEAVSGQVVTWLNDLTPVVRIRDAGRVTARGIGMDMVNPRGRRRAGRCALAGCSGPSARAARMSIWRRPCAASPLPMSRASTGGAHALAPLAAFKSVNIPNPSKAQP